MHVFLTGGTGFVGWYVLRALREAGHTVRALVRGSADRMDAPDDGVEVVVGDVTEPASLRGQFDGCDAVIHLVGIIEERPAQGVTFERLHTQATRIVAQEARRAGIGTFVHMSANGARPDAPSNYQKTKWEAEQAVRGAGFDRWTLFRPSIVWGDPGADDVSFEVQLARELVGPFPILPVFGDGRYELQPIHVESVASAFVQALTNETASGRVYPVGGRDRLTYVAALDAISQALSGKAKPKVHVPLWLVRPVVHTLAPMGLLPISPDQFEMLVEGNTCDAAAFLRDFEVDPPRFDADALAAYLPARA